MTERDVRPLRAFAEVQLGRQRSPEHAEGPFMVPYLRAANVKDGYLDLSDVKEMNFTPAEQQVFSLRPSDVLVSEGAGSLAAVGASAVWDGSIGGVICFQNTLLRLRPRLSVASPRFLAWWARHAYASGLFASAAIGVNIYHLSADRVRSLPVRLPSIAAQERVADFLDRETARIDTVVARKRRLTRLLLERRQSATGRILLAGSLNRLGTEEVGPSPFDRVAILSLRQAGVTADTGPFGTQFAASEYATGGVPMVNPTHIQDGRIEPTDDSALPPDVAQRLARHALKLGDIVLGRKGDVGRSALVGEREEGWIAGSDSIVLRTMSSRLSPQFLVNLLHLDVIRQQLEARSTGATLANVNESVLLSLRVPVPPLSEQERRASEAEAHAVELRRLIGKLEDQISLLGEHRQGLITAAVTGQIDAPGEVASPPANALTFADEAWRD